MTNHTTNEPGYYLDALAESFFNWFQNDILPVCTAMFDIIVILVGLILNILLLVTFKKRDLFNEPSTYFVTMLIISDFVSYLFLLLPNIITAIASTWILSQPVCVIHGSVMFLLVFVNFSFVCVLGVERAMKLWQKETETYSKIFENKKIRIATMIVIWALGILLAFIPSMGAGVVRYDYHHQGCMVDYDESPAILIVHFLLTFVASLIVITVDYSLIFNERRKTVLKDRERELKEFNCKKNGKGDVTNGNDLPTIQENELDENDNNQALETFTTEKPRTKGKRNAKGRPKTPKKRDPLLIEIFNDDVKNPTLHLSLTYLALWGTLMLCCLPYFIICFYGTFNDGDLWGGCYTISLLILHTSFAIKPVVYLGHNRQYRHVTKQTVPEKVRKGADSVRSSFSSMTETVEDLIFRSRAQAKFRQALATQRVVSMWKRRTADNKGKFQLKETPVPQSPVKHVSFDIKSDSSSSNHQPTSPTVNGISKTINAPIEQTIKADRASVTPSGVVVTTSPALVPVPSSYIERERQKLLNVNINRNGRVNNPSFGREIRPNENNVSPIPGMINEDLAIV